MQINVPAAIVVLLFSKYMYVFDNCNRWIKSIDTDDCGVYTYAGNTWQKIDRIFNIN